jgi:hypothetical protein
MSDERIDTRLHRYFDGDLAQSEAAELRQRLDREPVLRAKLDGLREIRALVRATAAPAEADLPSSDDLWSRIAAGIAQPEETRAVDGGEVARPALTAVRGGARASVPESDARPASPPAAVSSARTSAARRHRWAGIAIAGAALAAAVLLIVLRPGGAPEETPLAVVDDTVPPEAGPEVAPEDDSQPQLAAVEEQVFRTEVLGVDFGENSGAIFAIEGEDGERYAVVWLADVQPKPTVVE